MVVGGSRQVGVLVLDNVDFAGRIYRILSTRTWMHIVSTRISGGTDPEQVALLQEVLGFHIFPRMSTEFSLHYKSIHGTAIISDMIYSVILPVGVLKQESSYSSYITKD